MARIQKITRRNPLSSLREVAPESGLGFRVLATTMDAAFERFGPAAVQEMDAAGQEAGRKAAREMMGGGLTELSYRPLNTERNAAMASGGGPTNEALRKWAVGGAAARPDSFSGLNPEFGGRVTAMLEAAEAEGVNLKITSAYRSPELQGQLFQAAVQKYGSEAAARKWVAPPGASQHNRGVAVDFAGPDGGLLRDPNSPEAQWLAANASRFGLDRPMDWEPWQVEMSGSRDPSRAGGTAEVIIRTPEGNVEPRMYSPLSGPILQAHNAAAQAAFSAEVMNTAAVDLTNISQAHTLDPEGYLQSAQSYVEQIVENAPAEFRSDIENELTNTVRRSYLGIVEAKHSNIRQRASNETKALVERWSGDYARALDSGNPEEIATAQSNLVSALSVMETLPGSSWGPAQSQNAILAAEAEAQKIGARRQTEAEKAAKSSLSDILKFAKGGFTHADDGFTDLPGVAEMFPEEVREIESYRALNAAAPDLEKMPAGDRVAAVESLRPDGGNAPFEIDIYGAAQARNKEITTAWAERPVETAERVFPEQVGDITMPTSVEELEGLPAQISQRIEGMNALYASGHVDELVYLNDEDAAAFKQAILAIPELAPALAGAAGEYAGPLFEQIAPDNPGLVHSARLAIALGDDTVMAQVLEGQRIMTEDQISLPKSSNMMVAHAPEAAEVLARYPEQQKAIMHAAQALYAADPASRVPDMDDAAKTELLASKVQMALGQTTRNRKVYGGQQSIFDQPVILPPKVSGADVEAAMNLAAGVTPRTLMDRVMLFNPETRQTALGQMQEAGREIWEAAGGGIPYLRGEPLQSADLTAGRIRLEPSPREGKEGVYLMVSSTGIPLTRENGVTIYEIDLNELVAAARTPYEMPFLEAPEASQPLDRSTLPSGSRGRRDSR